MNIEESPFQFLDNTPKIRVIIRKRPLGKKELQKNDTDILEAKGPQTLAVRETKVKVDLTKYIEEHIFNFDRVFDETATNQQIYLETVRPLVESAFNGAKVTCFAYGQTGSGKTFTMMGEAGGESKETYYSIPGLYLLAAQDVFALLEQPSFQHLAVYISFYEIYCTKLHDLLNDRQQVFPREDAKQKVNIVGLSEKRVLNVHSLMQIIDFGNSARTTSTTSANDDSSRSHAILQITIKNGNKQHGKMSFIDLAGSERGADVTDTNKQTRMDGAEINKSLLALKECIRALDLDKKHTPFRGSKLTLVLKDSFTGNCKTVMIGNVSPAISACEHTLNTLRYADRVKELKRPTNENTGALSQEDLLARQLMLPRQQKNAIKMTMPDPLNDLPSMPIHNPAPNSKNSKARFSTPVFMNNGQQQQQSNFQGLQFGQQQQQQQQQMNYNQNQQIMYNNMNSLYQQQQQPQESLFGIPEQPYKQDNSLRDMSNLQQNQRDMNNNFPFKNFNKPTQNNAYQPGLYQNTNLPINNFAQINLNKKANEQDFGNNAMNYKEAPNILSRHTQSLPQDYSSSKNNGDGKAKNEENLQEINRKHEELINVILAEEEEVISLHRQHIDDMVDLIKQEMVLLHEVDKPASDIDEYVQNLDNMLSHKAQMIEMLKGKLGRFREHLKEEEALSKKFHEQKNEMMDIFDLNQGESDREDDMQLLENLHQVV